MKVQEKLVRLAPIAALSTAILLSPGATFAAENPKATQNQAVVQNKDVTPQQHVIQGYLIKNGIKTPVYKDDTKTRDSHEAPYPELSSNPNDPIPEKGSISSESGNPGSTLYFSKQVFPATSSISEQVMVNTYIEKNSDNSITFGQYNPETLEKTPGETYTASETEPDRAALYTDSLAYFEGTTVKRETTFEKLGSGVVPKNGTYTFSQAVTSGLSTADAIGGSLTLGYSNSIKAGGGVVPADVTETFSAQLTASYNHTITVTNQTTNTQTLSNPKAPDTYKYDKYVGAVYQLNSTYTIMPGPKLSKEINNGHFTLSQTSFKYSGSDLYLAVTPGAGS